MKCPVCQAQLLPVDGELFCLQCGEAVHQADDAAEAPLNLEDTSDPLLRRAIADASDGEVHFRDGIVVPSVAEAVAAKPKHSFASLRTILAPALPVTAGGMSMPVPSQPQAPTPEVKASVVAAAGAAVATPAASAPAVPAPVSPEPDSSVTEPVVAPATAAVTPAPKVRRSWLAGGMVRTWAIGVVGLIVFVSANVAVGNYFSNRVYPGVRAGNLAVGGWTFDELHQRLSERLTAPKLAALVDGRRYDLGADLLGKPSFPELEGSLKAMGRTTSLPLVGVVSALFSKPVDPVYSLSDGAVARAVQKLQSVVGRQPTNAVVMAMNGTTLVLSDKAGVKLDADATAAALRAAYGHVGTATLAPVRVQPTITAESYANDVTMAQTMMNLSLQVTVKKVKYTATATQIGGWLVFNGPGKGVGVDPAGVAGFVGAIPGSFDRVSAVNGLVAALNAHQGVALSPAAHVTANPNPASVAAALPLASYKYCIDAGSSDGAGKVVASTLGSGGGWTLGGRVHYSEVANGCNFVITIGSPATLKALDPACEKQTSCRIHNDLAIAEASWAKAPTGWVGDLSSYRTELVNHVVGQWLGFDHPGCSVVATQTPVLSTPSVMIPGCSPKWYAVPDELQDAKVLAGF